MTRLEQAAANVRKQKEKEAELARLAKAQLAEQRAATRQSEAVLREERRQVDNKQRYHWGALAQEAGLFTWSTADWQAVCTVLARLAATPHPAEVLAGLLAEYGWEAHAPGQLKSLSRLSAAPPTPAVVGPPVPDGAWWTRES